MPSKERTYNGLAVGDIVQWVTDAEDHLATPYKGYAASHPGPFVVTSIPENSVGYSTVTASTIDGDLLIRDDADHTLW